MAVLKDSNKTVEMMGLIAVELKEARKGGKKDYLMVVQLAEMRVLKKGFQKGVMMVVLKVTMLVGVKVSMMDDCKDLKLV